MSLLEHLKGVEAKLNDHGFDEAIRALSADIADFFDEDTLSECETDPTLSMLFLAAGSDLQERNAYNKDQQKIARTVQQTAHIYQGVPDSLARWGHEAHSVGAHAFGMQRAGKAPQKKILQAHQNAIEAHRAAEDRLRKGGHHSAADMHRHARDFHTRQAHQIQQQPAPKTRKESIAPALKTRLSELKLGLASAPHHPGPDVLVDPKRPINRPKKPPASAPMTGKAKSEAISGGMQATHDAQMHAHMANWRAQKLKMKLAKRPTTLKSTPTLAGSNPRPAIPEWAELEEAGKYAPEVKRASTLAAAASGIAKDTGSAEQHGVASRLHFIAHGVAKAHGHEDLAAKHFLFHKEHAASAQAARATGVGA